MLPMFHLHLRSILNGVKTPHLYKMLYKQPWPEKSVMAVFIFTRSVDACIGCQNLPFSGKRFFFFFFFRVSQIVQSSKLERTAREILIILWCGLLLGWNTSSGHSRFFKVEISTSIFNVFVTRFFGVQ